MAEPQRGRQARLVELLIGSNLDGLLVSSLPNIRYLTGFSGSNALLFLTPTETWFFTDFRYEAQVSHEVVGASRVVIETSSLWKGLWEQLAARPGTAAFGFESAQTLHRDFQRLNEDGSRWTWRPTTDLVERLRASKEPREVDSIRLAGVIATSALEKTLGELRAGLTENEVAGMLEQNLRNAGSDGFPFSTIVASGERSALPHARAGSRPIAPGDFVLLDFGAVYEGYCADVTRTVVVGQASERQRDVYEAVKEANERARSLIAPGMTGQQADAIARNALTARGFGEAFGHGLGHGLGIEVHEAPRLSRVAEGHLPEGAVVTIEPGVYLPGWGGVRIEDDVHLVNGGAVLLTEFPRDLIELD
ncbi:MAG TPA: Xaa-Pro peptidase family protein [Gemmatimonadaceae bacterium]|nr:Xaa-Pro peptidase family protein [Gemmatimonadaceae bacterium]